jgi:phosphoribosylanthranilate isomerase
MKIKLCGMCRAQDARAAAQLGADYVGVILTPGFARSQSLDQAAEIFAAANGSRRVGVFVDAASDTIAQAVERLRLDVVQLHGSESAASLDELRARTQVEIWKAVRVRDRHTAQTAIATYAAHVNGVLLDGVAQFAAVTAPAVKLIVAGGLHAGNVAATVAGWRPDVVDVSYGIEREAGVKALDLMQDFVDQARGAVGRFGPFGGSYVPETLVAPLEDLATA